MICVLSSQSLCFDNHQSLWVECDLFLGLVKTCRLVAAFGFASEMGYHHYPNHSTICNVMILIWNNPVCCCMIGL